MKLPRVVHVKLKIAPAAFSDFGVCYFSVVEKNGVPEQQVGDAVQGLFPAALDSQLLVTTTRTPARLIFEVMTVESANFQIVRSEHQREIVFPNVKIFTIGPWRLVPYIRVT